MFRPTTDTMSLPFPAGGRKQCQKLLSNNASESTGHSSTSLPWQRRSARTKAQKATLLRQRPHSPCCLSYCLQQRRRRLPQRIRLRRRLRLAPLLIAFWCSMPHLVFLPLPRLNPRKSRRRRLPATTPPCLPRHRRRIRRK